MSTRTTHPNPWLRAALACVLATLALPPAAASAAIDGTEPISTVAGAGAPEPTVITADSAPEDELPVPESDGAEEPANETASPVRSVDQASSDAGLDEQVAVSDEPEETVADEPTTVDQGGVRRPLGEEVTDNGDQDEDEDNNDNEDRDDRKNDEDNGDEEDRDDEDSDHEDSDESKRYGETPVPMIEDGHLDDSDDQPSARADNQSSGDEEPDDLGTSGLEDGVEIDDVTAGEDEDDSETLDRPAAVAVDLAGNLFIADYHNHRIQRVSVDGTITTVAGGNGAGDGNDQLAYPIGVAVDGGGSIFVADRQNHRIQRISADGTVTTVLGGEGPGAGARQLNYPIGVALDQAGGLIIGDAVNHRVQRLDINGEVTTIAGTGTPGSATDELNYPAGVTVGPDGSVYVADQFNHRIQRIAPDGTITTVAGTGNAGTDGAALWTPTSVAVDRDGHLYVADFNNHRVQRFDLDDSSGADVITVAGGKGVGDDSTQLHSPYGIALDGIGNLYIADSFNQRVQKLTAPEPEPESGVVVLGPTSSLPTPTVRVDAPD